MTDPNNTSPRVTGNGNPETFDAEWREALASGDTRWLSYPAENPFTQTELFERVKADQVDQVLGRYNIQSGRILEYACGSAGMSIYLAKRGFDVVALDLSGNALQLAHRNAVARAGSNRRLQLSVGDVFELPFPDGAFDVVMSYGLLEHFTVETLVNLLRETNRVLRPGGLHIVDIIHGRISIRTAATYLNFMSSACLQMLRGRVKQLPEIYRAYVQNYYENTLTPCDWRHLFRDSGLQGVTVQVCRPFPLLAISGDLEHFYTTLLKQLLPVWRWFDRTSVRGLNVLGWMYLAYGVKPST